MSFLKFQGKRINFDISTVSERKLYSLRKKQETQLVLNLCDIQVVTQNTKLYMTSKIRY